MQIIMGKIRAVYVLICMYVNDNQKVFLLKTLLTWGGNLHLHLLVKVKVTLVQALRLCTGRTAHVGRRGIALPFLDRSTRRRWGVNVVLQPLFTPGKDPVPIVQEAGWAPGPVWTGAENLAPTRIRSPDLPACSKSLYRLSYRSHSPFGSTWYFYAQDTTQWLICSVIRY